MDEDEAFEAAAKIAADESFLWEPGEPPELTGYRKALADWARTNALACAITAIQEALLYLEPEGIRISGGIDDVTIGHDEFTNTVPWDELWFEVKSPLPEHIAEARSVVQNLRALADRIENEANEMEQDVPVADQ